MVPGSNYTKRKEYKGGNNTNIYEFPNKTFFETTKFIDKKTLSGKTRENRYLGFVDQWVMCGFVNEHYYTASFQWEISCIAYLEIVS